MTDQRLRFKIDENLPVEVAEVFRNAGYDAETVLDEELGGEPDERVAAIAERENRVLVTLDLDFSDIRRFAPGRHPGIAVLRPRTLGRSSTVRLAGKIVAALDTLPLRRCLWIVEERRIRLREPGEPWCP